MLLPTTLSHVGTAAELEEIVGSNENVMVCCGRMGPMCVPVYEVMDDAKGDYPHVKFYDMAFDSPEAGAIRNLPECEGFAGLPFTIYYKNGKVAKATSSIQDMDQVTAILDSEFAE